MVWRARRFSVQAMRLVISAGGLAGTAAVRYLKRGISTGIKHGRALFAVLRWEYKLAAGIAGVGTVLIALAFCYAQFAAFLNPASTDARPLAQFGATDSSYCTDWAFTHAQIGKPTASPCGVLMIRVPISPSDAMPYA